jgi:hypothetical protein
MKINRETLDKLISILSGEIKCIIDIHPHRIRFYWWKIPYEAKLPSPIWGFIEILIEKLTWDINWLPAEGKQLNKDEITINDALNWFFKMLYGLKIEKEEK